MKVLCYLCVRDIGHWGEFKMGFPSKQNFGKIWIKQREFGDKGARPCKENSVFIRRYCFCKISKDSFAYLATMKSALKYKNWKLWILCSLVSKRWCFPSFYAKLPKNWIITTTNPNDLLRRCDKFSNFNKVGLITTIQLQYPHVRSIYESCILMY